MKNKRVNSYISCQNRVKLIEVIEAQKLSIRKAAIRIGIKYSTAKYIMDRYRKNQHITTWLHEQKVIPKREPISANIQVQNRQNNDQVSQQNINNNPQNTENLQKKEQQNRYFEGFPQFWCFYLPFNYYL